ncbi:MAG: hypothetical protein AB8G99_01425, partial [Planctomycetaceae bacterium]
MTTITTIDRLPPERVALLTNKHPQQSRILIMKSSTSITLALVLFAIPTIADDTIPGPPQSHPIALVGGTLHTVSGKTIENGTLVFDRGLIVAVGANVDLPPNTKTIDVSGRHVYPGLFEAHSRLGLTEISSTRATLDHSEAGSLNPNVQANKAVNPDSTLLPVTRSNGVLLALTAPQSGLVSGRTSIIQLDGWTYEDMTLKPAATLMVNWPRMEPVFRAEGDEPADEQNEERDSALEELRNLFADARVYRKGREAGTQKFDIRLESMLSVLDGEVPMLVRADGLAEIQSSVMFCAEQKVKCILLGGYDAPKCATLLKKHDVPVIVSAVHRRPRR